MLEAFAPVLTPSVVEFTGGKTGRGTFLPPLLFLNRVNGIVIYLHTCFRTFSSSI